MSFNLRASSSDFLTPVYTFPGDAIDPETYRHTIFNGYVSSVATIYGGARGYNLDIDAETFERWKRIGAASGLLDDYLDSSPDTESATRAYTEGLCSIFGVASDDFHAPEWANKSLEPAVRLMSNSVAVMPTESIHSLVNAARFIGDAVLAKSHCTDVDDYIEILKQEAYQSSLLIHGSVSDYVRDQPNFPRFARWCTHAIQLGTLVDCTWDLRTDKKHGITGVAATVPNSIRIARNIRPPISGMVNRPADRHATLRGLYARSRFSLLPTLLIMRRPEG